MANIQFNTNNIRRVPISRNNLFYSETDFQYEMEIGKNYLEQDMNQTIILYEVDLQKTNRDSIYGETKTNQIVFIYSSISEAERENKNCHFHIKDVCHGKRKTAGGYKWQFIDN